MVRILVTGGCGFIGKNFILKILASRLDVTIVNFDKVTYAAHKDMISLRCADRYIFIKGDLAIADDLKAVKNDIDLIINFAAESHVDRSIDNPEDFIYSNFIGTYNLLEFARARHVKRYLQVSTDEVYGSVPGDLSASEDAILSPSSPYSASKAGADLLVGAYHSTFKTPVVISRCSNNFGPFQFPEKLIPVIIKQALLDQRIPIYGDGHNVRDWLFVDDHCDALLLILEKGILGETYNIGAGHEWRNIDLVKVILDKLNKPHSLIEFVKDRLGHDGRYSVNSRKLSEDLGWFPKIGFDEGMDRTLNWYKENRSFLLGTN